MIFEIIFYIASFIFIWFGAGLIINSIDRIAKKLRLSSFAISFFVLGILTSIPEIAISTTAIIDHNPEIFVGTLLGGVIVIFLLIIPILAVFGREIKINKELNNKNILLTMMVVAAPGVLVIDHKVTNPEGLFLIILYLLLFFFIQKKHGIFDTKESNVLAFKAYSFLDLIKVATGIGMVFLSSQYIVDQTIIFSKIFNISTFYISLVILSLGTNLPELSLAIRAIISGKKEIAFGDYLGSAAANTFLFGFFTIINDGEVLTANNFLMTFIFIILGLGLFYYFSRSNKNISQKEGIVLFLIYILFVSYELIGK